MGAPVLNGPFTMPMFRSFVPKKMQPWIYVVFAFMFQISGGVYLGALNEMVGGHSLLREDLQTRVQPGGSLHHLPAAALGNMLH